MQHVRVIAANQSLHMESITFTLSELLYVPSFRGTHLRDRPCCPKLLIVFPLPLWPRLVEPAHRLTDIPFDNLGCLNVLDRYRLLLLGNLAVTSLLEIKACWK
jgi:hypothetical protein